MDEQQREVSQRDLHKVPPSLTAAIRVARVENAERSEVVAELRGAELARLEILLEALEPVLAQVPKGVDLFDVGIAPGEHPRLFIDMIGFVEMGRDRRVYRFLQDTRVGRVTIAETERLDSMVEALTAYIARRLIERDKALAADTTSQKAAAAAELAPAPTAALRGAAAPSEPAGAGSAAAPALFRACPAARDRNPGLGHFVLHHRGGGLFCLHESHAVGARPLRLALLGLVRLRFAGAGSRSSEWKSKFCMPYPEACAAPVGERT